MVVPSRVRNLPDAAKVDRRGRGRPPVTRSEQGESEGRHGEHGGSRHEEGPARQTHLGYGRAEREERESVALIIGVEGLVETRQSTMEVAGADRQRERGKGALEGRMKAHLRCTSSTILRLCGHIEEALTFGAHT